MSLRQQDCDQKSYNGLVSIKNIDDIQEKCTLKVAAIDEADKNVEGIYRVSDLMLGDRTSIMIKGIDVNNQGTLSQNMLGVSFDVYEVTKEKNPEYFL